MTLIVVTGAGASFDCDPYPARWDRQEGVHTEPWGNHAIHTVRPPLTQHLLRPRPLFEQLLGEYRPASTFISVARPVLEASSPVLIEDLLRDYSMRSDPVARRAVVAIRFLLQELLWAHTELTLAHRTVGHATNYAGLVDRLGEWADRTGEDLAFISFNYDLLLEHAVTAAWGRRFESIGSYVSDRRVMLLKPHGSVNWFQPHVTHDGDRPVARSRTELFERMLDFDLEPARELEVGPFDPGWLRQQLGAGLPVIALPVTGKQSAVCPDAHFRVVEESVKDAVDRPLRILTIGWRGAEDYFMDFLADMFLWGRGHPPTRCLLVTGDEMSARGLIHGFNRRLPPTWAWNGSDIYGVRTSGFCGLVGSPELEALLED